MCRLDLTKCACLCAGIALSLAGCVTTPIPNEQLAVAKASVQRAERAAADRAPLPAAELADQANADAQLAEATAQQQRSHKAAAELDANLQALRQETLRSTQPDQ